MNGVLLLRGTDYNTTTANTIGGLASLAANDVVEIIVYDVFSVANTVSQTGGTFTGDVTFSSTTIMTVHLKLLQEQCATQIDEGETLLEERAIMLEGTDSDFSNEGSLIIIRCKCIWSDAGEKLLFEANTLELSHKRRP